MSTRCSEVIAAILSDLGTLGSVARPGSALSASIPGDSPASRMAFSRPDILESPDPRRPGSPDGSASIALTLIFQVAGQVKLQGATDPLDLSFYDLGYRVRALFHSPTAHARTVASSVVVQRCEVRVAGENSGRTWAGSFELRVMYDEMPPETQST